MTDRVSRRGVYYDLTISPYEFQTPYGEIFKFSSQKKLDMYTRDIIKEIERLEKLIKRNELETFIPSDIKSLLIKAVYRSFYKYIER